MNEFEGKNCVIYSRVSSATQMAKGNWLQSQEALCKERAKANGVTIVAIYQDGWVSGKYSSRLWLDSMIDFLKKENKVYTKVDYVIVDDVDRIIRDVSWRWEIKNKIEKLWGAQIRSLKQKIEDTPEGKLLQSMTMSVKQYERESNARRVSDRKRARLLEGYRVHPSPFGYTYTGTWSNKKLIHTDKAHFISMALEKFSQWVFKNVTELWEYLVQIWARKKYDKNFAIRLIEKPRLLFYAWYIDFPRLWISMVEWKHEPIISLDVIEKIIGTRSKTSHNRRSEQTENFIKMPLRNTLCCEHCDKPMTWWPSYNKRWKPYYYYRCMNKDCSEKIAYNTDQVHGFFEDYLQKLTISPAVLECFKIGLTSAYDNTVQNKDVIENAQRNELTDIEKKIEKHYQIIMNTESSEITELYQKKLNELIMEKKRLESELATPQTIDIDLNWLLSDTLPILQNPYKLWVDWDIETKRLIPGVVLGGRIYYNKKSGITTPWIPQYYAIISSFSKSNSLKLEVTRVELVSKSHA